MTSQRPTVLVLGARGRFGLAAARAFAQARWHVVAQMRPGASGPAIDGVQWIAAKPEDTEALAKAAAGAVVVVHGLSPAYTHRAWRTQLPALTQSAIDAARALGATLMLPASVYNFGEHMPEVLSETTAQEPTTFKGRMRVDSEEQVRAAVWDGGVKAIVIRAGDFYGSGTGSWFDLAVAKDLPRGKFTYPGRFDVGTAWAYLPDLARTFVAVAERREQLASFETFHFAGRQLTGADWLRAIEPIAHEQGWTGEGKPLRAASMPWWPLRLASLFVPVLEAVSEMRYLWKRPYALANDKLVALIGEEPRTPFDRAVRESLEDLELLQAGASSGSARAFALQG